VRSLRRQSTEVASDGVTTRPWDFDDHLAQEQERLAGLIFSKASHLVAGYHGVDDSALERWASSVPAAWFNEEPGDFGER